MPTTQSLINYALLLVYVVPWWWREGWTSVRSTLQRKWWQYLLLAGLDVEANFLAVLAYQYTSLSSAMLLDCISIPCVMVLGHFVLKVVSCLVVAAFVSPPAKSTGFAGLSSSASVPALLESWRSCCQTGCRTLGMARTT